MLVRLNVLCVCVFVCVCLFVFVCLCVFVCVCVCVCVRVDLPRCKFDINLAVWNLLISRAWVFNKAIKLIGCIYSFVSLIFQFLRVCRISHML